jgi:hypothetical protein
MAITLEGFSLELDINLEAPDDIQAAFASLPYVTPPRS